MKLIFLLMAIAVSSNALADTHVNGYVKKNGTYVEPHYRSSQDNNKFNNYSTQGNSNPYTGQQGTVNPYTPPVNQYEAPKPYQYQDPYGNN